MTGGCIFIAAAAELDDQPGPTRDFLASTQKSLHQALARSAELAVEQGHFKKGLDLEQFAFELYAIILAFHHASRLLRDGKAKERSRVAFERLLDSARI